MGCMRTSSRDPHPRQARYRARNQPVIEYLPPIA
jgi:hypothetical protein